MRLYRQASKYAD